MYEKDIIRDDWFMVGTIESLVFIEGDSFLLYFFLVGFLLVGNFAEAVDRMFKYLKTSFINFKS